MNYKKAKKKFHFKLQANKNSITEFVVGLPSKFSVSYDISTEELFGQEFIPSGEIFESWSEIITVSERIAFDPSVNQFFENLASNYKSSDSKVEQSPDIKKEKNVPTAIFMVDTPSILVSVGSSKPSSEKINKINEILGIKAAQGNFSLAVVQYAIRYNVDTTSTEEKESIKKKVLDFLNSCQIETKNPL